MASEKCENCKVELQEYEIENGKCNICQSYNNTPLEEEIIKPKKGKK